MTPYSIHLSIQPVFFKIVRKPVVRTHSVFEEVIGSGGGVVMIIKEKQYKYIYT